MDIRMNEEKVSRGDLYQKLWSSRDFERSHLWQRSIFLVTFIIQFFALYFSMLDDVFCLGKQIDIE